MSTKIAGNTTTTANLTIGTTVSGSLDFWGDTDWWRVTLTGGFAYQIWLEGASSGMGTLIDPYLVIYNSDGTFQHGNDDYNIFTRDSYLTTIPNGIGGTFYISAEEFGNNGTGTYRLTAWLDQLANTSTAAHISTNSITTDRIGWRGDTSDWYGINLTAGVIYQFDLIGSARDGPSLALADGFLMIRSSDGAILASDDDSGTGKNARIFFSPSISGKYYLDVQEFGLDGYGVYSLIVNQSPVSDELTTDSSTKGTVDFLGDTDLYLLSLTAGVTYGFSVNGETLIDPYLEILDRFGGVLTTDDDSFDGLSSRLTYTPSTTGNYYLAARSAGNSGTGTYTASVWILPVVSVADATVIEGNSGTRNLNFTVSLSAPSPVDVTLTAGTRASTASTASGDYQGVWATTLVIPAGSTSVNFLIPVNGDEEFEPNEGLRVVLSDPVMAVIGDGEARGWIFDDDAPYALPSDWLLPYQWHLYPETGANVLPVWTSWRGAGVEVGVFDQGIDPSHSDLDGNLLTSLGRNASTLLLAGAPVLASDNHGTAVAGVIAAEAEGDLTVGVAPDASLVSIYSPLSGGPTVFASEIVNAYTYAINFDILNDSWGYGNLAGLGSSFPWAFLDNFRGSIFGRAGQALKDLAELGRDGLGTIVVQSAGNSYSLGDDTNLHNFQNSRYIITVAATDYTGIQTTYSSPGSSILIAAPGGGGSDFLGNIFTTDRTGASGYTSLDYVDSTGTSFSAPLVSGVVALMLEANPNLGYRDVQQILAYTARKTAADANAWRYNGGSNWNGGGLHYDAFEHNLGFGLVDALAAVRLAETWTIGPLTSSNDLEVSATRNLSQAIPDGTSFLQQSINISNNIEVERVEVTVNITHPYIGDLSILLTSPAGTTSVLLWRAGQGALSAFGQRQANIDFTFNTVLSMGESGLGTWSLSVFDMAAGDVGQLNSWTLNLIGKPDSSDDVYIYTNEFAESVADQASRATLTDASGVDTINAAAVTGAMTIDLAPGAQSTLDGRTLTIAAGSIIENAIAGDGGDTLRGNSAANHLRGMLGNDTLWGGAGDDILDGGGGEDTVAFDGLRKDYAISWSSSDGTYTVMSSAEGTDTLVEVETFTFSDLSFAASFFQSNTAPTLTSINTLTGATEDTTYTITYAALATAANESDAQGDPIAFQIGSLSSGTLTKGSVLVTPGTTTLAEGESLVWTPAPNVQGTLDAFTVKASDGSLESEAVQVRIQTANVEDEATGTLSTSGTAQEGGSLTANFSGLSDPDGSTTTAWQWQISANGTSGWSNLSGATNASYSIASNQSQVGQYLRVVVTTTDVLGGTTTFTGNPSAQIVNVNDAPTGSVTITGTPTLGQTLMAANTLADPDGLGNISYQWKANGSSIAGASGSSFTLTQAEVGKSITVIASYTDGLGTLESVSSSATSEVTDGGPVYEPSAVWIGASGHTYSLYKIAVTWNEANSVAKNEGGYLVKVDDAAENVELYGHLVENLTSENLNLSRAHDGGGSSYVWLGANDAEAEGSWVWSSDGTSLNVIRSEWGEGALGAEPDNFDDQDYLAIGMENWPYRFPTGSGYGDAGEWNDLSGNNYLYFIVESESVNQPPQGMVVINGNASVGQVLTASNDLVDADGLGTVTYNWYASGSSEPVGTGNSYTITQAEVGKSITVIAIYTDQLGTVERVTSSATSAVVNINNAPTVFIALADQSASVAQALSFAVLSYTFTDVDDDTLSYSASLANGDPLPSWLSFNSANRTFSGTPTASDLGMLSVRVTASDGSLAASDTFSLTIQPLQEVSGNSSNDQLEVSVGSAKVDAGDGIDTVVLPLFPNEFELSQGQTKQAIGTYGAGYALELNDVEYVQFGGGKFTTKIALDDLISGFAQEQLSTLTDLYLAFFGRAPDVEGLEYWQRQLLDVDLKGMQQNKDFKQIAKDFAWSEEAKALYPLDADNREFVRIIYQNCFSRDPDQGGWDYWTGVLNTKGASDFSERGLFVAEVLLGAYAPTSGEEDRGLLTNKHDVAMYYVNQLAQMPQEGYDAAINDLLGRLEMDETSASKAISVIDYAFNDPITLTGIMGNQSLLDSLWP